MNVAGFATSPAPMTEKQIKRRSMNHSNLVGKFEGTGIEEDVRGWGGGKAREERV